MTLPILDTMRGSLKLLLTNGFCIQANFDYLIMSTDLYNEFSEINYRVEMKTSGKETIIRE